MASSVSSSAVVGLYIDPDDASTLKLGNATSVSVGQSFLISPRTVKSSHFIIMGDASTRASNASKCSDSVSWYTHSSQGYGCDWVSADSGSISSNSSRCAAIGNDKTVASESCPFACGTCPALAFSLKDGAPGGFFI